MTLKSFILIWNVQIKRLLTAVCMKNCFKLMIKTYQIKDNKGLRPPLPLNTLKYGLFPLSYFCLFLSYNEPFRKESDDESIKSSSR